MGRLVDVELLVDAGGIAARSGVGRPQTVFNWRQRHADFPDPVAIFGKAVVWYWPDVEAWLAATGRQQP